MNQTRRAFSGLTLAAAAAPFLLTMTRSPLAATPAAGSAQGGVNASTAEGEQLQQQAKLALQNLTRNNAIAESISKTAKAVLVFPKIIKAGLVFGGSYGEGVLFKGGKFSGYYNSVSASWGWQAGVETYGYAVFLMTDSAIRYLDTSKGWEIGVGPHIVLVNEGVAKNLSTTTLKDDAYGFIFDQTGLLASLSIEGTKITRIQR